VGYGQGGFLDGQLWVFIVDRSLIKLDNIITETNCREHVNDRKYTAITSDTALSLTHSMFDDNHLFRRQLPNDGSKIVCVVGRTFTEERYKVCLHVHL